MRDSPLLMWSNSLVVSRSTSQKVSSSSEAIHEIVDDTAETLRSKSLCCNSAPLSMDGCIGCLDLSPNSLARPVRRSMVLVLRSSMLTTLCDWMIFELWIRFLYV